MTIEKCLTIGILFLLSCGTKKPQTTGYIDNADANLDTIQMEVPIAIATDEWMTFDTVEQVSYVDLYKYGRLKIPGKWKHANSQFPRFVSYENSEYHILQLDMGILDTMHFYKRRMAENEILTELYEQGITLWREKKTGQIQTIEKNPNNIVAKLIIEPTQQIFFLCGIKRDKTMTLYLIPKIPDDIKNTEVLRKVFNEWSK